MIKSRKLVVGDIHGGYLAFFEVLNLCELSKNDTLIFLGDYVDGWSETPQLIDCLVQLNQSHHCIFLRGNHDQLFLDWLLTGVDNPLWLQHGGEATVKAYQNISSEKKKIHIDFLQNLELYHLDEQNRLFVHAGFTNPNGVEHEYFPKMFFWDRTLWETALVLDPLLPKDSLYYPKRFLRYSQIFIGHTPVTRINQTTPVNIANIWNVDTGAAFKGPLTIMDIDSQQYWQSKPVFEYYPNETGRN